MTVDTFSEAAARKREGWMKVIEEATARKRHKRRHTGYEFAVRR
jgi:hypothetical protein